MTATVLAIPPRRCPVCGRPPKRSSQANRRYWSLINQISGHLQPRGSLFSSEAWHLWLKSKFLGMNELKLPNGKIFTQPSSSADLSIEEFSEYFDKCQAWAAEHGIWLEE